MKATKKQYKAIHKKIMASNFMPLQNMIDDGMAWTLEGSYGRSAMEALEDGRCVLADKACVDCYGNEVPAWFMVKEGTKGGVTNAEQYYREFE